MPLRCRKISNAPCKTAELLTSSCIDLRTDQCYSGYKNTPVFKQALNNSVSKIVCDVYTIAYRLFVNDT